MPPEPYVDDGNGPGDYIQSYFPVGSVIDNRYETIRLLGIGGTSSVYVARDLALDGELIALKILKEEVAKNQESFARFRNEVILSRRLAHPNIARIFDFGHVPPDLNYFTVELVEGGNIIDYLERNKLSCLPFEQALGVLFQVSIALDYAHRHQVLHRDIKPDNILLAADGLAKLADFGAARAFVVEKGITQAGHVIGTPHYMAPEAMRGEHIDSRADIYSFGICAFEIVTGKLPFEDVAPLSMIAKSLNHPLPQINSVAREIPGWFQDFVEVCTEKDAAQRFQSVSEIAKILSDKLREMGLSPNTVALPQSLQNQEEYRPSKISRLFSRLIDLTQH